MAYCCGLISKGLFNNIIAIGDIRNRFAHAHLELDFDDELVVGFCNKLRFDTPASFTSTVDGRTLQDVFTQIGSTPRGLDLLLRLYWS